MNSSFLRVFPKFGEHRQALRIWILGLLCLSALGSSFGAQGENGYLRGEGHWLLAASYQKAEFEETLGAGAGAILEVDRSTAGLYINYGLRDDLDLVIQPLYSKAKFGAGAPPLPVTEEENLTDLQVYAKWRLWKRELGPGELHFLLSPGLQTDLKNYQQDGFLSLGAGQTDWRLRSITHYQARTGSWYAALEAGYDFRTGEPADNLVIRTQLGIHLGPVLLQPYYDLFDARGGSEDTVLPGTPAASGLDYDVWGIKAFLPLSDRVGIFGGHFELDDDRPSGVVSGFGFGIAVSG